MIMSLGTYSHKDGDWSIWKEGQDISIYSIEQDDISASIYDNWVLSKSRVESMLEMSKTGDKVWIEAYERDKKEAETYGLKINREFVMNGTTINLHRSMSLDRNTNSLDDAKKIIFSEMGKIKLIKIGE